ncbi:MAG: hypothetical protein Q8S00_26040 [Deltaproteobacteria bacterium]|nr:hypothetical protein [Deltaproteobacteria bacterium]
MGGQSAGLIHATTQIVVSDIDRVGGHAKIPPPSTVTDNFKAALLEFIISRKINYYSRMGN